MKVPPAWDPSWQASRPFRTWAREVTLWSAATDVPVQQQGAAVVLRLGGAARELCMELDPQVVQNGQVMDLNDGNGPLQRPGLFVVLRGLSRKYAPLGQEVSVQAIAEATSFAMRPGESIDSALSRFETMQFIANRDGGFNPGPSGWSWMLLKGLSIHPQRWIDLLRPFNGQLPVNDAAFQQLVAEIRGQYHLLQADGIANASGRHQSRFADFASGQGHGHHFYPTFSTAPDASHPMQCFPCGGAGWQDPGTDGWTDDSYGGIYATDDAGWSSSGTDDETENPAEIAAYLTAQGIPAAMHGDELWHNYLVARRKWRSFTNKPSRFARRSFRKGGG